MYDVSVCVKGLVMHAGTQVNRQVKISLQVTQLRSRLLSFVLVYSPTEEREGETLHIIQEPKTTNIATSFCNLGHPLFFSV